MVIRIIPDTSIKSAIIMALNGTDDRSTLRYFIKSWNFRKYSSKQTKKIVLLFKTLDVSQDLN